MPSSVIALALQMHSYVKRYFSPSPLLSNIGRCKDVFKIGAGGIVLPIEVNMGVVYSYGHLPSINQCWALYALFSLHCLVGMDDFSSLYEGTIVETP